MLHSLCIWKLYVRNWEIYEHKRKCMQHGIREQPMARKDSRIQHRKERWLWFLTCKISNKDLVIWMLLKTLYENTDIMKDTLIYSSHLENPKIRYSISKVLSVSHRPLSRSVINFGSWGQKDMWLIIIQTTGLEKAALPWIYGYIMLLANSGSVIC